MVGRRGRDRAAAKSVGPVRSDDRGQLVLIGAVVVAVLIVGLVVVFNSALFTENIDKGGADQSARDATEFADQVQGDTRALTIRVNHAHLYDSESALNTSMAENVTGFDHVLAEGYADSEAAYASVDYDGATFGDRAVQHEEEPLDEPGSGFADWAPVAPSTDVGWLVVNLNLSEFVPGESFSVKLDNGTGEMNVTFSGGSADQVEIAANFTHVPAANETITCRGVRGRLLVDVLGGDVYGRSCSFNATEFLAPPYEVHFVGGDAVVGTYEMVVEDGSALGPFAAGCSGATSPNPCVTPAIWEANVSVEYSNARISYTRNWSMEVYNGTHGPD